MDYQKIINYLLALLKNPEQMNGFIANPADYFKATAITDAQEQGLLYDLVVPLIQAREMQVKMMDYSMKQAQKTDDMNDSYRNGIIQTNRQIIKGFSSTMLMYQVSFYLGVVLIIAALFFALFLKSSLFSILFGSIGAMDLLTFFIAKPPQSLQESRSEQAKLNAAFYSWFLDLYNWNSFYVQFTSKGQAIDFATMKEVSELQIKNTAKLMEIINQRISANAGT